MSIIKIKVVVSIWWHFPVYFVWINSAEHLRWIRNHWDANTVYKKRLKAVTSDICNVAAGSSCRDWSATGGTRSAIRPWKNSTSDSRSRLSPCRGILNNNVVGSMKSRIATTKSYRPSPVLFTFPWNHVRLNKKATAIIFDRYETIGTIETRFEFSFNEQFQFLRCVNISRYLTRPIPWHTKQFVICSGLHYF